MQVPAIQLAELLAVLAEIESDMAGQAGPIGISFFDTDVPAFEADKNLRVRIRIERRLEADFELSRIEVLSLHAAAGSISAHVAGDPDLRIELGLIALATHRLRQGVSLRGIAPAAAGGLIGRGAQRGEIVADRRRCGLGCRSLPAQNPEYTIESRAELPHLRSQRVHLALRRLLAGGRGRD